MPNSIQDNLKMKALLLSGVVFICCLILTVIVAIVSLIIAASLILPSWLAGPSGIIILVFAALILLIPIALLFITFLFPIWIAIKAWPKSDMNNLDGDKTQENFDS
jgi:hypothetical protein